MDTTTDSPTRQFPWRKAFWALLCMGIIIRVLFVFFGAKVILGNQMFVHGDTANYVNAGINLVDTGTFDADPGFHEAKFSRVPLYSMFYAAAYSIAGKQGGYYLMAALQFVLSILTMVLLFFIGKKTGKHEAVGLICMGLFAIFPFEWFWLTTVLPDVMTTFIMFAVIWATIQAPWTTKRAILVGVLFGIAALTREYLVPLFGFVGLYLLINEKQFWKWIPIFLLTGALVYSPWPLRNYINHNEVVLLRSASSGSRFYQEDARMALKWLQGWSNLPQTHFESITKKGQLGDIPEGVFADEAEKKRAEAAAKRAFECGTSFQYWREGAQYKPKSECMKEVADEFEALHNAYKKRNPIMYWVKVPGLNIGKVLFKSSLVNQPKSQFKALLIRLLFLFRTVLVLSGIVGFLMFWRNKALIPSITFAAVLYGFMCFVFRGVQMRYLLQSDLILLVPASMLFWVIIQRLWEKFRGEKLVTEEHENVEAT